MGRTGVHRNGEAMQKEKTIVRSVAWPESMYKALRRQARKHKVRIAAYVRHAVEQQLRADGENVQDTLMWGGARWTPTDEEDEDEESEWVAEVVR
jgi:hypothetical protein